MRSILCVLLFAFTSTAATAQTPADVMAALGKINYRLDRLETNYAELREQFKVFQKTNTEAAEPTYEDVAAKAFSEGKPLVVFLGVNPRKLSGVESVATASLPGFAGPAVIVATPGVKWMELKGRLPANATDQQIAATIRGEVRPMATPFRLRGLRFGEIALPDDDASASGRWPKSLVFFKGMVRYRSAKFTQAIYTLNNGPAIDPVERKYLKQEWQVPGGMEGVHGWKSDLYKFIPEGWQREWQNRLPVKNSFGNYQYELGYTRAYPDGTFFVDALSNEHGKPFEVRVREKQNGQWQSYIAWKDVSERPAGYAGLTKRCNECHNPINGPGSGEYGVAMVSGADTVFSDPFPQLEVR